MDLGDNTIKIIDWNNNRDEQIIKYFFNEKKAKTIENMWVKEIQKGKEYSIVCCILVFREKSGFYMIDATLEGKVIVAGRIIGYAETLDMAQKKIDSIIDSYKEALEAGELGNK